MIGKVKSMTKFGIWTMASVAGVAVAGVSVVAIGTAAVGCSSSSDNANNGTNYDAAAPDNDSSPPPAPDAPSSDAPVAVAQLTLTWNVTANDFAGAADGGDAGPLADASSPDANAPADGGPADAAAPDAALADGGTATTSTAKPVAGAQVCIYGDSSTCVMTGDDGVFRMQNLPPYTNIVLSIQKSGYWPALRAIQTAKTDMDGTDLAIGLTSTATPISPPGEHVDLVTKGLVTVFSIGPLPDGGSSGFGADFGASLTLSPDAGDGPFFPRDNGTWDPDASSLVGTAADYLNVPAGTYEVTIHDSLHDCAPITFPFGRYGFPSGPTTVKFPVVAGYVTGPVGFFCTSKSTVVATDQ
jgi:hypothetical protein